MDIITPYLLSKKDAKSFKKKANRSEKDFWSLNLQCCNFDKHIKCENNLLEEFMNGK